MKEKLEDIINKKHDGNEVKLHGKIFLNVDKGGSFTTGGVSVKGAVLVNNPNIIIDGSDAEIEAEIDDCTTSDWALFFISPSARGVQFKNMNIHVYIRNPKASSRRFSLFYNTAHGVKFINCHLELFSQKQLNLFAIYNNGNLDTHLETRADNLVVNDCFIKSECLADEYLKECSVYGLYNYLANSISVLNTFICAINRGNGSQQRAVGIYTNGRFGRFVGNNIKANGYHNKGLEKEQANACGFINEGPYSLISSNNIVGECGGRCIGLETSGEYVLVSGNKILSTHTICGRNIITRGNCSEIIGNVLTSTSRNARLIELNAQNCIISQNVMDILMMKEECRSGCGIYAAGEGCNNCFITENIIRNVMDVGVYVNRDACVVHNNMVNSFPYTQKCAYTDNYAIKEKLDDRYICSIRE